MLLHRLQKADAGSQVFRLRLSDLHGHGNLLRPQNCTEEEKSWKAWKIRTHALAATSEGFFWTPGVRFIPITNYTLPSWAWFRLSDLPQKRSFPMHSTPFPAGPWSSPRAESYLRHSPLRAYPYHLTLAATLPVPFPWPLLLSQQLCFSHWIILRIMFVDQIQQILHWRVILRLCFLQILLQHFLQFFYNATILPNWDSHPQLRHILP